MLHTCGRNFTVSRQPKIQDLFARISGSSLDMTSFQQQLDVTRQMYSSPQQKEANRRAAIRECLCAYRRVMASIVTACPKVGENIVSWLESRIGSDLRQLDKIVKFRLRGKRAILDNSLSLYPHGAHVRPAVYSHLGTVHGQMSFFL